MKFRDIDIRNGAQVYYSNGPETDPQIIADMQALGFTVTPKPRTSLMALKQALYEKFTQDMVRPLKNREKNGYTVIHEKKGEQLNEYPRLCNVTLDNDKIVVSHLDTSCGQDSEKLIEELTPRVAHFKHTLPGASISEMMVGICMKELDGTSLRDCGGIYFVPQENVDRLIKVAELVEQHGNKRNRVTLNNFSISASTLRDISASINTEVEHEMTRLRNELMTTDLGERALDNRADAIGSLMSRVERYESILGESLTTCRSHINEIIDVLSAATAVDEADEVFDDLYEEAC